ncbi:MAG: ion channel [Pseudomonadota bacterium]
MRFFFFNPNQLFVLVPIVVQILAVLMTWGFQQTGRLDPLIIWMGAFVCTTTALATLRPFVGNETTSVLGWVIMMSNLGSLVLLFAFGYEMNGLCGPLDSYADGCEPKTFMISLYYSIVTFTTLGYGEFIPTEASRWFAATRAILGYLFLGTTVSMIFHWASRSAREGQ